MKSWLLNICLGLMVICTTACSSLKVSPAYQASSKNLLSTIPPKKFTLVVEDKRVDAEKITIGQMYNAFGGVAKKIESTEAVTNVLFQAIKSELEHNGHEVINDPAKTTDRTIKVELRRFFFESKPKMWDVELVMNIMSDINIASSSNSSPVQIPLNATLKDSMVAISSKSIKRVINEGLTEYFRIFALDSGIQNALKEE